MSRIKLADKWAENANLTRSKQPKILKSAYRSKRGGHQPKPGLVGPAHGSAEPPSSPLDAGFLLDGIDQPPMTVGGDDPHSDYENTLTDIHPDNVPIEEVMAVLLHESPESILE
uniref:Uncharacterized protein n=1 Tax=Oryza sativa subsp. japonica TaxID=39947 RepID=Q69TQ0_ORYSJ|nr:hypothetical protein [Oryza sativa Japonica Group]BAD35777.1 hypothetical protein [Oryza sativa Japonica Group]